MARRELRGIALGAVAVVALGMAIPATNAYFEASAKLAPIVLTVAPPAPPSVPCPLADFSYGKSGAEPYPMLSVRVWAKDALPANCALSFSLNSYTSQGPDWPSTGTQALYDHQTMTLDAAHPSGTLTVVKPPCYGQTDFYTGTIRFDGVDGALPHYPDSVVPQPLLAWSNGGKACKGLNGSLGAPDPSAPIDAPSPDPSASPDPTASANPPLLAPQPPVASPDQPVVIAPPSPDPSASPDPSTAPTPTPTATPAPTDMPTRGSVRMPVLADSVRIIASFGQNFTRLVLNS